MSLKNNLWHIINTVLILALLSFLVFTNIKDDKKQESIVYIDNIKIFSEFNMTKDLGKENEKKYVGQVKEFDSLLTKIKGLESNLQKLNKIPEAKKLEYAKLQKVVVEKDRELKKIQSFVKNDISTKVWKRLNDYIKTYGKNHSIDLILGAQGSGNIMYGEDKVDITKDFIKFANNKYEGN